MQSSINMLLPSHMTNSFDTISKRCVEDVRRTLCMTSLFPPLLIPLSSSTANSGEYTTVMRLFALIGMVIAITLAALIPDAINNTQVQTTKRAPTSRCIGKVATCSDVHSLRGFPSTDVFWQVIVGVQYAEGKGCSNIANTLNEAIGGDVYWLDTSPAGALGVSCMGDNEQPFLYFGASPGEAAPINSALVQTYPQVDGGFQCSDELVGC
jgi:hypothetical protein